MNTSGSATSHLSARQCPLARPASAARRETALFAAALGAVGLHIVDDNFLQPESGTAATGHLLSGLVPLALIVGAAACYGRARPGFRAVLALVFGVLGVLAWRVGISLVLSLGWAFLVLVLVPRQFGLPLLTLAQGLPDLAYVLLVSGAVALVWGIAKTAWACAVLHGARPGEATAQIATA